MSSHGHDPRQQRLADRARATRANESPSPSMSPALAHSPRALPPPGRESLPPGQGRALPANLRAEFSTRMGQDLSGVRLHEGASANDAALAQEAKAFTLGDDVVLGKDVAPLDTQAGRQTLAHELAHVVQQRRGGPPPAIATDAAHEVSADRAASAAVSGSGAIAVSGGTGVGVARQPMDPRHARGYSGEQGMGFELYPSSEGWVFVEGPSGAAGHNATAPGFDGVAYNTKTGELHIIDNKSFKRSGNVQSATAITKNLSKNLNDLIAKVSAMSKKSFPYRDKVLSQLKGARDALAKGQSIPAKTKLIVTNSGGRSTGVSQRLKNLGVEFRDANAPQAKPPAGNNSKAASTPGKKASPKAQSQKATGKSQAKAKQPQGKSTTAKSTTGKNGAPQSTAAKGKATKSVAPKGTAGKQPPPKNATPKSPASKGAGNAGKTPPAKAAPKSPAKGKASAPKAPANKAAPSKGASSKAAPAKPAAPAPKKPTKGAAPKQAPGKSPPAPKGATKKGATPDATAPKQVAKPKPGAKGGAGAKGGKSGAGAKKGGAKSAPSKGGAGKGASAKSPAPKAGAGKAPPPKSSSSGTRAGAKTGAKPPPKSKGAGAPSRAKASAPKSPPAAPKGATPEPVAPKSPAAKPAIEPVAPKGGAKPAIEPVAPKGGAKPAIEPVVPKGGVKPTIEPVVPKGGVPEPGMPAPKGGGGKPSVGGGIASVALPIIAGLIHNKAVEKRVEKQAGEEGFVPHNAPSGEGLAYDLGAWLLDPMRDAEKNVDNEKRFKVSPWRQKVRNLANSTPAGETFDFTWEDPTCGTDLFGHPEVHYDYRKVTYKKGADGRLTVESGDASGTLDLNDVIDDRISDEEIDRRIPRSTCGDYLGEA